ERIAAETGTALGEAVGYQVRFTEHAGAQTLVKLMTDGILLAELARDRALSRYDTIVVDEAHERSLNVDFILGYLKQLLPRRPDLKVVITSATIDPERFSRHFDGAPVVEVSGRTYPVEVRYRPVNDPDDPEAPDRDQTDAVCDAVTELRGEPPGDILVFLSGEREIRDTADALRRLTLPDPEILRTNLASVILQMTALGLGDMAAFPFIDPPDRRQVAAGVQLLEELGALDAGRLTPLGRRLAQLPVDPRLARMVLEADRAG